MEERTTVDSKPTIKMPELLVFAKLFVVGFVGAEIFRAAFYLGYGFGHDLNGIDLWAKVVGVLTGLAICLTYMVKRGALRSAAKVARSLRLDLLMAVLIGIWSTQLTLPGFSTLHAALMSADAHVAPTAVTLLCVVLLSPLFQQYWPKTKQPAPQLYFIPDDEIVDGTDDLLASEEHAKSFAKMVLASGAHAGLVFGVDGPWGVAKTSFINPSRSGMPPSLILRIA